MQSKTYLKRFTAAASALLMVTWPVTGMAQGTETNAADSAALAAGTAATNDPTIVRELRYADALDDRGFAYYARLVRANIKAEDAGHWAQTMAMNGQERAALDVYRSALKIENIERPVNRQLQVEMAELIVKIGSGAPADEQKKLFKEARKIFERILWVPDIWFVRAVMVLAQMKVNEGDVGGANKRLDDLWVQLKAIHDMLREYAKGTGDQELLKISPMAECHYRLGVIMQDEAEKLIAANVDKNLITALLAGTTASAAKDGKEIRSPGALQHLTVVFTDYPSSIWAADARERSQKIRDALKRLNVQGSRHKAQVRHEGNLES